MSVAVLEATIPGFLNVAADVFKNFWYMQPMARLAGTLAHDRCVTPAQRGDASMVVVING
jgi:hypothetical protein